MMVSKKMIPILHNRIKSDFPKLIKFALVGLLGSSLNLTVYYFMTEIFYFGFNTSAIGAFSAAVSSNYILNHEWTFCSESKNNPINFKQFTHYLFGNLIGLLVNLLALNMLVSVNGTRFHLLWQMLGIACGMLFNFTFARKFVFTNNVKK
jgi:dolichol-phosphate mannosyltransferase